MITRARELIPAGSPPSQALLRGLINEHVSECVERLQRLRDYYDGKQAIMDRQRAYTSINNRVVVNHARYITMLASGYLVGSPVSYASTDQPQALDQVRAVYDACDIDSVDMELARHASIYGRGVELLYSDTQARPCSATMDPRSAWVVYSDSVDHEPLLGMVYAPVLDINGNEDHYRLEVYDAATVWRYRLSNPGAEPVLEGSSGHFWGGVPLTEFWNNAEETGDYEGIISLMDAYNTLVSDRVNDKAQLVDALLVITGAGLGDDDGEVRDTVQKLRAQNLLELPINADAKYLAKQLSESDVQVLADALRDDIHAMSMVPRMTDKDFAGNASGVAMRYKLLGLEQLTKDKERWFREGLRTRLRMVSHFLSIKGQPVLDADQVQITFTRSLPVNELEQAQLVSTLRGTVPDAILLRQLPFVDDVDEAMEMMRKQQEESAKRQAEAFALPTAKGGGEQNGDESDAEDTEQ